MSRLRSASLDRKLGGTNEHKMKIWPSPAAVFGVLAACGGQVDVGTSDGNLKTGDPCTTWGCAIHPPLGTGCNLVCR